MNIYVPGKGNPNAKILIVGEAPSYAEESALEPFVGSSGQFLDSLLARSGISRNDCWLTNVSKYMVPANHKEGKAIPFETRAKSVNIDLLEQIDELRKEVHAINPNIIIMLGGTALKACAGKQPIQKWRGSIISAFGYKALATYHPAHILHSEGEVKGYWNKPVMEFDLKRALNESQTPTINLPVRTLSVVKHSHDFSNFIDRYKGFAHPAIDIEAHKCIPICVGIAFTPTEGITIPLWNHVSKMSAQELVNCWKLLATFLGNHDVVGQNFGYDRDKLRRLGFTVNSLHNDTMLRSFAINPELPKNLAFNTSIYTREPYYKDEGMYEGSVDDLLTGCACDACTTKEVELAQQEDLDSMGTNDYYRNFLLPLHEIYHYNESLTAIEQVGFRIDESLRLDIIKRYIEWDENLKHELFQLTGELINSGSPKQVSELLYDKLKLPRRKGTGEEVVTQLLANAKDPLKIRIMEIILEDRRVKKTLTSYAYSPSDYDGRMRTSYFLCLETGRSSTSQQDPPIRPKVKGLKKADDEVRGMAFQTITKHGDIGTDIRKFLVCDPGTIFIQADLSQAEARVIFKLAKDEEALKLIDTCDYHALTASWFFGGTEHDHSKKVLGYESPIRFCGKTLRHAGHLGASKKRASIEVNTQARKAKIPIRITEKKAGESLEIFHAKQPSIRHVFHEEIRWHIAKNRKLIAPVPYGINAKVGGTRIFFERDGEDLYRQAYSYIPQRTVSEHIKAAAMRIRSRASWIIILVEAHDALLVQVEESRKDEAAEIIRFEFTRPIDFSTCSLVRDSLVIPCDIETGYDYKDLK